MISYRTKHYEFKYDDGPRFISLNGCELIDDLDYSYTTCSLYNIKEPVTVSAPRRIVIDHLDDLKVGDKVCVVNNMYGFSCVPTYQFQCIVAAVGLDSITVDCDLPNHIMQYSTGIVVLRRSLFMPMKNSDAKIERVNGGAICSYFVEAEYFNVQCWIHMSDEQSRVNIRSAVIFTKPCRLYNLSLALRSKLPITTAYLKNRKKLGSIFSNPIKKDIWLWKEGCCASDGRDGWICLHNPGVSSVELLTPNSSSYCKTINPTYSKSTLVLNLEHYNGQHYRRHKENFGNFSTFDEMSLPAFEKGVCKEYIFGLYVGRNLSQPPRLMLAPKGFRAVHVWTEHADRANLETQRAAYFGDQNIDVTTKAIGGFVKHKHVVTKSIFCDNPTGYKSGALSGNDSRYMTQEVVSYKRNKQFRLMLDELSKLGYEICIHGLTLTDLAYLPYSFTSVKRVALEVYKRYAGKTWVDHGEKVLRYSMSWQGMLDNGYSLKELFLCCDNISYIWLVSSSDFMPRDKQEINLLHNAKGTCFPTPLYWRHPALLSRMVIWAAHEAPISAFSETSLNKLIQERGVSINHHYYPYIPGDSASFGYIERDKNGCYKATSQFNEVLASMAKKRDEGELYITTIGDIVKYWVDLESIAIDLYEGGFTLRSNGTDLIQGLAFVVYAKNIHTREVEFKSRLLDDGDLLVWFDMPSKGSVTFETNK